MLVMYVIIMRNGYTNYYQIYGLNFSSAINFLSTEINKCGF